MAGLTKPSPDMPTLMKGWRLLLQRQRQKSGLSLAQVAKRLGAKSRNAYVRYEQGVSVPTVDKLDELLRAVAPGRDLVLQQIAA